VDISLPSKAACTLLFKFMVWSWDLVLPGAPAAVADILDDAPAAAE
jgi:hypothetical protein